MVSIRAECFEMCNVKYTLGQLPCMLGKLPRVSGFDQLVSSPGKVLRPAFSLLLERKVNDGRPYADNPAAARALRPARR